jgi:hypothetical protein
MVGKSKIEEKYPDSDYPNLTEEQDPDMVCCGARGKQGDGRGTAGG